MVLCPAPIPLSPSLLVSPALSISLANAFLSPYSLSFARVCMCACVCWCVRASEHILETRVRGARLCSRAMCL